MLLCQFWLLVATMLDKEIDSESDGVPKHLGQVADSMSEWEGPIAEALELSGPVVADIKCQWPKNLKMQKYVA